MSNDIKMLSALLNSVVTSYVCLVNCLKNSGALEDGRLENALERTINDLGADSDRLDSQFLTHVLDQLRGRPTPEFRVIPGGKSEED